MKFQHTSILSLIALLTGCGIGGMAGPFPGHPEFVSASNNSRPKVEPAAPQVVYRIDEDRYFEVVPVTQYQCSGTLYYTDKAQGIHKSVAGWSEISRGDIIIDAANTDYLVGPILPARGDCAADTANRPSCSSRLPYSTDGGRSWKYGNPRWTRSGDAIVLTGEQVFYAESTAKLSELTTAQGFSAWTEISEEKYLKPRKAPLDTQFHCNRDAEN